MQVLADKAQPSNDWWCGNEGQTDNNEQILDQLHSNHMGIEKMWLFVRDSVQWMSMNADIEHMVKRCTTCLEYQHLWPKERALHHEMPCIPWKVVGADVFMINDKAVLCIVDYHNKFQSVKKVNSLPAYGPVQMTKLIFVEYSLPKKIVSDMGTNMTVEAFITFCRKMNIEQTITSS